MMCHITVDVLYAGRQQKRGCIVDDINSRGHCDWGPLTSSLWHTMIIISPILGFYLTRLVGSEQNFVKFIGR